MNELLKELIVAGPSAAAVIIVVLLFLRHLKDAQKSRDAMQSRWMTVMGKLSGAISELTTEVHLLRDRHEQSN